MSFSVVAVLILVLSAVSVAALSSMSERNEARALSGRQIGEMEEIGQKEAIELQEAAYALAIRAVDAGPGNESALDQRFQLELVKHLGTTYPKTLGGFAVSVNRTSVGLMFLRLNAVDAASVSTEIVGAEALKGVTIPAYLTLAGNFTIIVSSPSDSLVRAFDVERHVYIPTPLLANRIEAFSQAFDGGRCEFENTVRYEISTLAQSRALRGYGMTSMLSVTGTEAVVTAEDVENAVGLAVVLEQLKNLRSVDQETFDTILDRFPASLQAKSSVVALLESGGVVDPADLFLRLCGDDSYDLRLLLGQTLYAAADVLVLRWLDYLHVLDVTRFLEEAGEAVQLSLASVLDSLLGVDTINRSAVEWMEKRLRDSGLSEDDYRYLNEGGPDAFVTVPSVTFGTVNDKGEVCELSLGGTYAVDFPTRDVLASSEWKRFLLEYKTGTFELAETLKAFVQSIALGIASSADLPALLLPLDPLDDSDFTAELEAGVRNALSSSGEWFARAVHQASIVFQVKDRMGEALSRFVSENWCAITGCSGAVDAAVRSLAERAVADAVELVPGFDDGAVAKVAREVEGQIQWGSLSGVRRCVEVAFEANVRPWVTMMERVFGNLTLDHQTLGLDVVLAGLVAGTIEGIPGVQAVVERMMLRTLQDMRQASSIRVDRMSIAIPGRRYFSLLAGNTAFAKESLLVDARLTWLAGRSDGLKIEVKQPWEFPHSVEDCPNRHTTDLTNLTLTPFATQWAVTVQGEFDLTISADPRGGSVPAAAPASVSSHIDFGFEMSVITNSGWPMAGVEYAPTMTLMKQVAQIFDQIWQAIVSVLQWIGDGIGKVFSFVQDVFNTVLSYATKVVEWISGIIQALIEGIRDIIEGAFSAVIGWLADSISGLIGQSPLRMNIFGLGLELKGGTSDLAYGYGEMVRVSLFWPILDGSFSITTRFLRLRNAGYDVVVNGSLNGQGWGIEGTMDPLMRVMDHFLEIKAWLNGFMVDLVAPEVTQYEKASFALSDIPAVSTVLSNIPSPIPGFNAAIDAGFEAKFNRPFDYHVVINEVELNPPGPDANEEWIELYNPMLHEADLAGWTVETAHGMQVVTGMPRTVLSSGGRYLIHFQGQVLDNGGESGLPVGESVVLRDAEGKKVDSTPFITDYYNDERTWQRSVDASEHWEFKKETRGERNGATFYRGTAAEEFLRLMADAVGKAFAKAGPINGLDGLAKLVTSAIEVAMDYIVDTLGDIIVEVSFFVELKLQDYSGSMNGGFRLSLVVTGQCIRDGLRWVADAVLSALGNVMNPSGATPEAHSADELLDDIYIRFGAYVSLALPKLVAPVRQGELFRFGARVEMNLAAILAPNAGHNWSVGFGALFEGVPADRLSGYYGLDADRLADVWIIRATLSPTPPSPA